MPLGFGAVAKQDGEFHLFEGKTPRGFPLKTPQSGKSKRSCWGGFPIPPNTPPFQRKLPRTLPILPFSHSPILSQRGAALLFAMVAAVVVALTAGVVLNLTLRRFELSALRANRAGAVWASEAGAQYAFRRLEKDAAFRASVQNKRQGQAQIPYVVTSQPAGNVSIRCGNSPVSVPPDERKNELFMGTLDPTNPDPNRRRIGKEVTVAIVFDSTGRFKVCASADY